MDGRANSINSNAQNAEERQALLSLRGQLREVQIDPTQEEIAMTK